MFGKFKGWFSALSSFGKASVILAVVSTGAIVNAVSQPNTAAPPPESPPVVQANKIEIKTETTTEEVPFETKNIDDSNLAKGKTEVRTEGVNGVRTKTWEVTYTDGKETGRVSVNDGITTAPITEIIAHGTKVVPQVQSQTNCTPGYSPCIAQGSDVDCAGGSGNGPRYVSGPVYVTGSDPYDLDRDGDGVGCE